MRTVKRNISDLNPAVYNPRKITDKQMEDLKTSIKKFGFVEPVIVNMYPGRENTIISGHQRVRAMKEMNKNQVDCLEVKLDEDQEKELNIRMNKAGGEFDLELLDKYFSNTHLLDFGFEEKELVELNLAKNDIEFNTEVGEDYSFDNMERNVCPSCGFEWQK